MTFKGIAPIMKAMAQRLLHHNTRTGCEATGRSGRRPSAILAALLLAACLMPRAAAGPPAAVDVRAGSDGTTTRLVIDLTAAVAFEVFTLADPDRIVLDLATVQWRLPEASRRLAAGPIAGLRWGQFDAGRSRLVVDLAAPAGVRRAFLMEPDAGFGHRLVVDLAAGGNEAGLAATEPAPATEAVESVPVPHAGPVPPRPGFKPLPPGGIVVVVDPGHGGDDPGAIGASGTREKALTLTAARELKRLLEARGPYRVVLTRDDDRYLKLARRVALARRAGADLFISIHADSAADPAVRGAGVYTLSETASDKEAEALARQENKADLIDGIDLVNIAYDPLTTDILIDLAQRGTMNASSEFASLLTRQLADVASLRGNAHRFAGFRVLKAPDVPSVLLEMGFLSNATEERRMLDADFRRRLMQAVVAAIDAYFAARRP